MTVPGVAPRTEAEWARSVEQRLRRAPSSIRIGEWALNAVDGRLLATKPGETLEVGTAEPVVVDVGSARGFITDEDKQEIVDTATQSAWEQLYNELTGILPDVDALGVLGDLFKLQFAAPISSFRLPMIPLSSIRNINPNLLVDGDFTDPRTLLGNPDWEHDPTDGYGTPLGCAKTTADGTTHIIHSIAIEADPGETWDVSCRAKWEELVSSGAAVLHLSATAFQVVDDAPVVVGTPTLIGGVDNPTGDSGGTGGWGTVLSGGYTVPATADYVIIEFTVTAGATSGTAKFDKGVVVKSGLMPMDYIKELLPSLANLEQFTQDVIDQFLSVIGGIPVIGGTIVEWAAGVGDIVDGIDEAAGQASDALMGLGDLLTDLVNNPAEVIGQLTQDMVDGLEDDLAEAGDAIADVFDDVRDTWNKIVGGYRRDPASTGQTSADVEEVMLTVGQDILVAQESTITLANQANAPKNVPFWVSPNSFEDVSFPRSDIQPELTVTAGSTGASSSLSGISTNWNTAYALVRDHTHPTNVSVSYSKPLYTIPAGTLALSTVRITQDRIVNVARFLAGGGTPPSTALYIGLYQIDIATGNFALIYNYGDQKGNVDVGSDLYDTPMTLPADTLVDAGAMYAVGVLPVGGSYAVAAIRRQPIVSSAILYPASSTELLTGQSTLPSSITETALNHTATHRIWVSIGQAVDSIPEDNSPVTLSMTFNVSNTSNWTSPSFQQFGTSGSFFGVDGGQLFGGAPTVVFGDDTDWRSALCLTPVHTNDHAAEITLGGGWNTNTYGYTTTRAYVRCNSSGSSGVAMHLDSNATNTVRIRIASITDMISLGTVRATATAPYVAGDRFRIEPVGNVYQVYRNDVAVVGAVWTDSGGAVPSGKAWRRPAFGSGCRNVGGLVQHRSAYIDSFKAWDVAA